MPPGLLYMDAVISKGLFTRHTLVDTRSPEEAREQIGRIFCPHFLSPKDRHGEGFHAVHRSARHGDCSLNFVSYGAEVEIDPGELSRFFLLQVPLSGSSVVRCGTETIFSSPGRLATLVSPTLPTRMRWSDNCDKLIVLVDRQAMQRAAEALTGRVMAAIEFAAAVDMEGVAGRLVLNHVRLMAEAIETDDGTHGDYLNYLGQGLAALLITALPHSQRAALERPAPTTSSRAVARAEEWIRANIERAFAVAEIAEAADASLRTLQNGVRRERGTTLTGLIETIRLDRFRAALCDSRNDASVTEIAGSVGLGHLGRAAAAYRRRYGETPSQTLRKRR